MGELSIMLSLNSSITGDIKAIKAEQDSWSLMDY